MAPLKERAGIDAAFSALLSFTSSRTEAHALERCLPAVRDKRLRNRFGNYIRGMSPQGRTDQGEHAVTAGDVEHGLPSHAAARGLSNPPGMFWGNARPRTEANQRRLGRVLRWSQAVVPIRPRHNRPPPCEPPAARGPGRAGDPAFALSPSRQGGKPGGNDPPACRSPPAR